MTPDTPPGVYRVYAALTALAAPALTAYVARKQRSAGVPAARLPERRGTATQTRPSGRLVWFHAASVGESQSILRLLEELRKREPDLAILVTTVTATAAKIIAERTTNVTHQYAPIDTPAAVRGFIDHWRPDLAVFVESELWPRLISRTAERGIPLALINARLSEGSQRNWARLGRTAGWILGHFTVIAAQRQKTANALTALGAAPDRLVVTGDLKSGAAPLPCDPAKLSDIREQIGDRNLWVAASTHPGEEALIVANLPKDCLCVLAPRHPERGDEVAALLQGLKVARRSKQEIIQPNTQVYLADTLGEMGLWYSLAPVVFLGGSLVEIGGHNPFEPAQFGAAILYGPHVANFRETYAEMAEAGAVRPIASATDLPQAIRAALQDDALRAAAQAYMAKRGSIVSDVADLLLPLLKPA
ncbi:MAG: 3-deoxy-D-manno-octulosonic acid transferase [Pseudomonadota bacterium]